ncbi:UPF0449 protein C19orf25 homolog [Mytilus trossulus]|uniref:UPF0449 protein C19orf25 homolog n=1 Tax=Mytilus trossulus TaxID=6551 RepID=UPI0030074150
MHKNKPIPERPKPPSFKEIIEDVDSAPNDDVVFSPYSSSDDIKEKSTALEESYLETSELNIENESPQDEAYDQAVEFIKLTNKLESAPTLLDEQFRRLQELKSEVSKSINKLKESSEALQS